ncbi:MAG: IclR family transcriptional regulator C-terminal domain-containing protein [Cohaesibacteraceae bacterium]
MAVPLYLSSGLMVGAVNVGGPTLRMSPEEMVEDLLPKLQETVTNITLALRR